MSAGTGKAVAISPTLSLGQFNDVEAVVARLVVDAASLTESTNQLAADAIVADAAAKALVDRVDAVVGNAALQDAAIALQDAANEDKHNDTAKTLASIQSELATVAATV